MLLREIHHVEAKHPPYSRDASKSRQGRCREMILCIRNNPGVLQVSGSLPVHASSMHTGEEEGQRNAIAGAWQMETKH